MKHWFLDKSHQSLARLTLNILEEKLNTLSQEVFLELDQILDSLKDEAISCLIFESGKKNCFIAGADIEQFTKFSNEEDARSLVNLGQEVFNKIAALPFPTVAFIDGICLGGGLELALACTFRITTDNPKILIGLPEVKLGLVPGWGGTQRLPRLIGILKSMDLILTGRTLDAIKANKLGISDSIISHIFPEEGLQKFITQCTQKKGYRKLLEKQKKGLFLHRAIRKMPFLRSFVFNKAKNKIIKKTKGHYPAPLKALELLRKTTNIFCPLKKGLKLESNAICSLSVDPVCRI